MGGINNIHGRDEGPLPPIFGLRVPAEKKSPVSEQKVILKITRCASKPWGPNSNLDDKDFTDIIMSTTDKVSDLMRVLGLKCPYVTRDVLYEITKTSDLGWKKGLILHTLDDLQGKELRELGWNEARTGRDGERPFVYLWACEDTDSG